ncbi:cupin domain protein [Seiridium cupressi]
MEKDANGTMTVSELGRPKRYITDHDGEGKGVFNTGFEEDVSSTVLPGILLYDTFLQTQTPIQMNGGADLKAMKEQPPHAGLLEDGTTVARFVDFLPGAPAVHHRTASIDFAVLISGELELLLDSGESRLLKPGDHVVQRGTKHAWRNVHPTDTARVFFVQSSSEPLVIKGEKLGESIEWPEEN